MSSEISYLYPGAKLGFFHGGGGINNMRASEYFDLYLLSYFLAGNIGVYEILIG